MSFQFIDATIKGYLFREPEPSATKTNEAMLKFTILTDTAKEKSYDNTQSAFITCCLFGKQAEYFVTVLHKGQDILVSGQLNIKRVTGQNGDKTYFNLKTNRVEILKKYSELVAEPTYMGAPGQPLIPETHVAQRQAATQPRAADFVPQAQPHTPSATRTARPQANTDDDLPF